MRVVIPLASASRQLSGVPRHAINIARCLLTRSEVTSVHLIVSPWQQEFVHQAARCEDGRLYIHAAQIGTGALARNLWYYARLPQVAIKLRADIVHLAFPAPLNRRSLPCPAVLTLHDMYPYEIPENFGFPKVLFNRLILRQCLQAADAVACVSRSTWSQLERIAPKLAHRKGTVVANCVEPALTVAAPRSSPAWSGQPFLLCISQHRRNKNILFLLQIFERLLLSKQITSGMRLVIVGIEGPETRAILRLLHQASFADRVILLRGISEEELQWSYANCELLIAPSSVEGFGLPRSRGAPRWMPCHLLRHSGLPRSWRRSLPLHPA